jgi:hypothetical protein
MTASLDWNNEVSKNACIIRDAERIRCRSDLLGQVLQVDFGAIELKTLDAIGSPNLIGDRD